VRAWLDALLAVLLAPSCLACQRALTQPTRGPACADCWLSIAALPLPYCDRCGDPLTAVFPAGAAAHCERCQDQPTLITCARAAGVYDGALRAIVHGLKYGGHRSLAGPLSALMRERGDAALQDADVAIPVPLHPARQRGRGFNQAADLARGLGLPVIEGLRRVRATATQADLPAHARTPNVRGAFAATTRGATLRGSRVVLVDDVSTTGATLDACALALVEAGVAEVRALTAARVLTRPR
jgi:ComF family protein